MIIKSHPELGLQEHQQEAYKSVLNAFETGNRASVVMPTGCGKSFVSLQLIQDNPDKNILFMAPSKAIKNQMYRYIAKYIVGEKPTIGRSAKQITEEHFPNFKIMLYPTLTKMNDGILEKLNPDIIIMDELHRTRADKWGEKIDTLLYKHPNAKVMGLTATPDRNDNKNVVDELFNGKIDYELTLVDAIKRGIVKPPKYVKCDYALGEMLEDVKEQIELCDDEATKKELQVKYDRMRRIVDQAEGIPELFAKNMTKKDGKYIVFCKDKEHMLQMMEEAKKWFADIDSEPEMYSVYAGDGNSKNQEVIKKFEESKSSHLKLLFSIDMLNEGLHVEDISGVIMLRPTESRTIYLQQLGRALSSDTSRDQTIIFDLVNNYLKINLDREINTRNKKGRNNEESEWEKEPRDQEQSYDDEDIDIFRIQGETKEFLELFDEVSEILVRGMVYLKHARDIKKWMVERNTTKPPSENSVDEKEKRLGRAMNKIRYRLMKKYLQLETEEEKSEYRKKYPGLEEIIELVNWIDENKLSPHLENARKIKKWMEERNTTKPPSTHSVDKNEIILGRALSSIRLYLINPYLKLETEEEKENYKKKYPELEEVKEIVDWIDENNISKHLKYAREIKKWMVERDTTKPPTSNSKDKTEKDLGSALARIRKNLIKPYLYLNTDEERENYITENPEFYEVNEIIDWIDENNPSPYLINARAIKKWMEDNKRTNPPSKTAKDETERDLGLKLKNIRDGIIKTYSSLKTDKQRKKYVIDNPELEEIMEIINWIDENNISEYLKNARKIKEWMEERNTSKLPSMTAKDKIERDLGLKLKSLLQGMVKKYLKLESEEDIKKFKEKYPELDEVLGIVEKISLDSGDKKRIELAKLIQKSREQRRKIDKGEKNMSKENGEDVLGFRERLKVEKKEIDIPVFPTDESVLSKMDPEDKMYLFNIEDIDKRIKIPKVTKERRTTIFVS